MPSSMQLFPPFTVSCQLCFFSIASDYRPISGPMPTASQPPAKRILLDDSQVQAQGTVMVLVRWYVLMVCMQGAIVVIYV